jgi:hypothetical protein
MSLRRIGDAGTRSIGDLDARIRQASDLGYTDHQQNQYRQYKGEFYEGLPTVLT